MSTKTYYFKFNKKFVGVIHNVLLLTMLHSTFVAPCQGILQAYVNLQSKNIVYGDLPIPALTTSSKEILYGKEANVSNVEEYKPFGTINKNANIVSVFSGQQEGIIGVSKGKPLDSPVDNLFAFDIEEFPLGFSKAYLKYEVYGVADASGVARSINTHRSYGGHIVKLFSDWSQQREEIDINWLNKGNNTVLFTTGAAYQYKIRNLSVEFERSDAFNSQLVVNSNSLIAKDGKVYIKGFLRNAKDDAKVYAGETPLKVENGEFEGLVALDQIKNNSKIILVKAFDSNGYLGQEPLLVDSTTPADYIIPLETGKNSAMANFNAFKQGRLSLENASIIVQDSALTVDSRLSITPLRHIDIAPLEAGMVNVTKGGKGYRFLPDGTKFVKPVSLNIDYDKALIPNGYTPKDIKTYFFDTSSRHWKEIKRDSIDNVNNTIKSQTTHFTDYINGIIQTPESPEVNAFAPTMMNDVKAADPASEMTLISPPQASQTGEGNISYPIKIPAGRNGMQPNVGLQYSNNGGNGWLGEGWNISSPAITIDTRWGVPLHDPVNESELYNLNGDQLMYPNGYLPNRHIDTNFNITSQTRVSNTVGGVKIFKLRKEGGFSKIERYGNSPATYYWKVTNSSGTVSWYGGKTASDVTNGNAVIKDQSGRIVHWALYMVEDVFGNQIKYSYASPSLAGLASQYPNLANCKTFYLDTISYTGYNDTQYFYSVQFTRQSAIRPDVTINARLGLKQANPYLLDKIIVKYNSSVIRSYQLNYISGKFDKKLLTSIVELDANNLEFYRHNFNYYDDVAENDGHLFGPEKTVNFPTIDANFTLGLGDLLNPSKISTTQTSNNGFSIKPSLGVEVNYKPTSKLKNILVGAPYSENTTRSKGKIELVDIDGDGIDDILFKASGGLRYFPGVINLDTNGSLVNGFASGIKTIHNVNDFSYGKIKTNSVFGDSWDVTIGVSANHRFTAGTERTKNKSEGSVYLTDANNDGLMDIVSNGVVKFNYINTVTGEPTFTAESSNTPNLVLKTSLPIVSEPAEEQEEQENPETQQVFDDKYDVVRVWQAPVDGTIQVIVKLLNLSGGEGEFVVEKLINGNRCTLLREHIVSSTNNQFLITKNNVSCDPTAGTLRVTKGEQIYFRLHRNTTGQNPEMVVSTEVDYLTVATVYASNYAFQMNNLYTNSFMLTDKEPVTFPGDGTATITWNSFQPTYFKDAVKYGIYKRSINSQGNVVETTIQEWNCPQGIPTTISSSGLNPVTVNEGTSLIFKAFSDTNVFIPDNVALWRPKLTFTPTSSAQSQGVAAFEKNVTPDYNVYHADSYTGSYILHTASTDPGVPTWSTPTGQTTYGVKPNNIIVNSNYLTSADSGSFLFAVRGSNGNIIEKRRVTITSGVISISNTNPVNFCINCALSNSTVTFGPYRFEYYVDEDNIPLFEKYKLAVGGKTAILNYGAWSASQNNKIAVVSYYYDDLKHLGPMLNNWGQFMYNSSFDHNTATPTGPIGKLINPNLVVKPFTQIDLTGSAFLNVAGCNPATMSDSEYESCYTNALMGSLNIPAEGTDMSSVNVDNIISGLQGQFPNLDYSLPLISMSPVAGQNFPNDKWQGFYNSQYISYANMRSGSADEVSSESPSSGSGLSYPDFTNEEEPVSIIDNSLSGMKAINKIHRSSARSNSVGWGWSGNIFGASGIYGTSRTSYSNSVTDFMDINGDGYPDIVTTDAIQKTNRTGGHLASYGNPNTGTVTKEENTNSGIVASGQYLRSGRKTHSVKDTNGVEIAKYETSLEAQVGVGVTANLGGQNEVNDYWADLNGDGLPDRIKKDNGTFNAELNYGQNIFGGAAAISEFPYLNSIESSPTLLSVNAGLGAGGAGSALNTLNQLGFDFEASVNAGYSASAGRSDTVFIDINGDGLADKVDNNEVHFNKGIGFNSAASSLGLQDSPNIIYSNNQSIGVTGSIGAFFGFPIVPFVLYAKAGFTFSAQSNVSINQDERNFRDMNGDGFVDYLKYESGQLKVKYSNIGRTNMLKTVNNPLGGSFTMDYQASTKSYGDPNGRWNLVSVMVNDGYDKVNDGADSAYTKFVYENGNYDRRERQFYGYETVKTLQYNLNSQNEPSTVYTTNVAKYHNKSYFLNGLVKESYILAGSDENLVFSKSVNTYALKTLVTATGLIDLASTPPLTFDTGGTEGRRSAVALLTETTNYIYELGTTPLISKVQMQYNNRGRVLKYIYLGNVNNPSDDYTTDIKYHSSATLLSHNLIDIPSEITVSTNNGGGDELKRKRTTGLFNENTGAIGTIKSYFSISEFTVTNMEYDVYGNLIKVTLPPNNNQEAMFYNYRYDDLQHKYLVNVADALSYKSFTDYDPKLDKVLIQEDIAGNVTNYAYDSFGRLKKVTGPKEHQNGSNAYTIKMDYYPRLQDLQAVIQVQQANFTPVAVTSHYDRQHPGNDIQTYTFVDGFDRVVQVKKDIELPRIGEFMSISGKATYDAFGRVIEQFHPYFENKSTTPNFRVNEYQSPYSSKIRYDQFNRVLKVTISDDSGIAVSTATTNNSYGLDLNSYTFKTTSAVSQNGSTEVITESHTDVNGRVVETINVLTSPTTQNLHTTFDYNAIGELKSYTDAEGISTNYEYDLLGRKMILIHPDGGMTNYTYDAASNLTGLQTANLANNGSLQPQDRFIKYNYYYNLLADIHYPDVNGSENISNVFFEYGQPGVNGARKVNYQRDATGEQWFEYGNMGELTKNIRSVVGPNIPTRYFTTVFEYDSWNRLQFMLYPDGEKVVYNYNLGGNLKKVSGEISGQGYDYITNIDYDYFEQRVNLLYGNGTETNYAYSPSMRRLKEMRTKAAPIGGVAHNMFYNYYLYDNVGNVTNVSSPATANPVNGIGGDYKHEYYYDNMNRLTTGIGSFSGDSSQASNGPAYSKQYNMVVEYNATNGMATKSNSVYNNITQTEDYQDTYNYESGTHRLVQITDAASNPVGDYKYDNNGNIILKAGTNGKTYYLWDESNRLRVVIQDEIASMQHYIYDASGQRILKASSNIESVYENGMLSDQSTITLDTYTTYPSAYIVLKGSGEYTKHYYAGSQRIVSRIGERRNDYFENEQPPRAVATAKGSNAKTFDADALKQLQIKDLSQILEKSKRGVPVFKPYDDNEEKEEIDETPPVAIKAAEDKAMAARAPEAPSQFPYNGIYFYHPDHLGTTSYLTDANGQPYQMFMNMPFGESLMEQHSFTEDYETPFKFNGKELDAETGLYYYGARYYDPRTSIWLSVDPLAEKYPNFNPYVYCLQNPVNLVDPDGMQVDDWVKNGNQWTWRSDITSKEQAIIAGFDDYSDGITNNTYQSGGQEITLGKDRNWTKGGEKFTAPDHAPKPNVFSQLLADFTGGSQVLETHNLALSASTRSDGNRDWAGYSAHTLWLDKINNFGGDMGSAATPSLSRRVTATGILQSFDDIVANPKFLIGRTADEIGSILGDGWTKGAYGSSKTGWKFMGPNDGQSIFFHPGGGRHGGSYYGFSSGKLGKTKIVGADYKPLTGDKATIIK